MKKLLCLLLALVLTCATMAAFSSCGGTDPEPNGGESDGSGDDGSNLGDMETFDCGAFSVKYPASFTVVNQTDDMLMAMEMSSQSVVMIQYSEVSAESLESAYQPITAAQVEQEMRSQFGREVSNVVVDFDSDEGKITFDTSNEIDGTPLYGTYYSKASAPNDQDMCTTVMIIVMETKSTRPIATAAVPTVK